MIRCISSKVLLNQIKINVIGFVALLWERVMSKSESFCADFVFVCGTLPESVAWGTVGWLVTGDLLWTNTVLHQMENARCCPLLVITCLNISEEDFADTVGIRIFLRTLLIHNTRNRDRHGVSVLICIWILNDATREFSCTSHSYNKTRAYQVWIIRNPHIYKCRRFCAAWLFIGYRIDVGLKAWRAQLLLSAALQRRIIFVLLTASIVWLQSQGQRELVRCQTMQKLNFLEHCQIIINWLIVMAKAPPMGERGRH